MIPPQLQDKKFRFIRVRGRQKKPLDNGWQKGNNYLYDEKTLQEHLERNGNYGVATGYGGLLVIDFDDEEFQQAVFSQLPRTFGVKTGSGGLHLYYLVDDTTSSKITTSDGKTLVDIQGTGKQVIGSGSTHPNGKKYEVLIEAPITEIRRERLNAIIHSNGVKRRVSGNMRRCPFHEDKNASLATYDDESFFCFGCKASGTIEALNNPEKAVTKENKQGGKHYYIAREKEKRGNREVDYDGIGEQARELVNKHGLAFDKESVFWKWSDGIYRRVTEGEILELLKEEWALSTLLEQKWLQGYQRVIKLYAYQRFKRLNPQGKKIGFKGGIGYDFQAKKKIEVTPETFYLNSIPHTPSEEEDTPTIDRLFKTWVGEEKAELLKDLIAYCCLPQNPLKLIIFTYGSHNSGKTTYNRVLEKFFGKHNTHSTTYSLITDSKQRFETINFRGKLAVFCSEVDGKAVYNTVSLKQISGGDSLRGEYKGVNDIIQFYFGGLLFVACNDLPQIKNERDSAFKGRAVVIDFPQNFQPTSTPIEETIPEEEYDNLARWCLNKLEEWSYNGISIRELATWEERVKDYTHRTNPIQTFCEECIEWDDVNEPEYSDYEILGHEFAKRFNEYVVSKGQKEWDKQRIGSKLSLTFKERYERKQTKNPSWSEGSNLSKYLWSYRGMRWKNNQHNHNNQQVGLHSLTYSDGVQSSGYTGYVGDKASTARFQKLPHLVFHKCLVCGLSPCEYQDEKGRPICEFCLIKQGDES